MANSKPRPKRRNLERMIIRNARAVQREGYYYLWVKIPFAPHKGLNIKPLSIEIIDNGIFVDSKNLKIDKENNVIQFKKKTQDYWNNANGLVFAIPKPKSNEIEIRVTCECQYLNQSKQSVQKMFVTLNNLDEMLQAEEKTPFFLLYWEITAPKFMSFNLRDRFVNNDINKDIFYWWDFQDKFTNFYKANGGALIPMCIHQKN